MTRERFEIHVKGLSPYNYDFFYGGFTLPHIWQFESSRRKYFDGENEEPLEPIDYRNRCVGRPRVGYSSNESFIKAGQGLFSLITQKLSTEDIGTPTNKIIDDFFKQLD